MSLADTVINKFTTQYTRYLQIKAILRKKYYITSLKTVTPGTPMYIRHINGNTFVCIVYQINKKTKTIELFNTSLLGKAYKNKLLTTLTSALANNKLKSRLQLQRIIHRLCKNKRMALALQTYEFDEIYASRRISIADFVKSQETFL